MVLQQEVGLMVRGSLNRLLELSLRFQDAAFGWIYEQVMESVSAAEKRLDVHFLFLSCCWSLIKLGGGNHDAANGGMTGFLLRDLPRDSPCAAGA